MNAWSDLASEQLVGVALGGILALAAGIVGQWIGKWQERKHWRREERLRAFSEFTGAVEGFTWDCVRVASDPDTGINLTQSFMTTQVLAVRCWLLDRTDAGAIATDEVVPALRHLVSMREYATPLGPAQPVQAIEAAYARSAAAMRKFMDAAERQLQ